MPDQLKIPVELIEQFAAGNGLLWLGAGASVGSGLPSWEALINSMAQRLVQEAEFHESRIREMDLLEIAELFRQVVGDNYFYAFLRQAIRARSIDTISHDENDTLRAVAKLANQLWPSPGLTIVTTNYDSLLEEALLLQHGKKARRIVTREDLAVLDSMKDLIVLKPNGDIDYPESIVLTLTDYCEYRRAKSYFATYLENLLSSKTVLFVGYGLGDFTFRSILGELRNGLGSMKRRAFMIARQSTAEKQRVLRALGVEILDVKAFDEIPLVLRAIAQGDTTIDSVSRSLAMISPQILGVLKGSKLLWVDDDDDTIQLLITSLRHLGWDSTTGISDPREALELIESTQFDIIITDVMMAGISGRDIVRASRASKHNKRSIVAFCSGASDQGYTISDGADIYFAKPFKLGDMLTKLFMLKRVRDGIYF